MMISPSSYMEQIKSLSYEELIKERKRLVRFINSYEKESKECADCNKIILSSPHSDVKYQCYLEYLAKLCIFMKDKYRMEHFE